LITLLVYLVSNHLSTSQQMSTVLYTWSNLITIKYDSLSSITFKFQQCMRRNSLQSNCRCSSELVLWILRTQYESNKSHSLVFISMYSRSSSSTWSCNPGSSSTILATIWHVRHSSTSRWPQNACCTHHVYNGIFSVQQHICTARYMLSPVRLSVRPFVCQTGVSYKNG